MSRDDELGRTIRQLVRERRVQTEREHVAPEDLAAYYDRDLSPQRAEEVEAHLAWCPGCVQVLKALEELDGGLGNLPPAAVSKERVEASFRETMATSVEWQGRRQRPLWLLPAAAGLAAAILLAVLILPWAIRLSRNRALGNEISEAGVPSADLDFSPTRSPGDAVTRLRVPPGVHLFVLDLWLPPQLESALLRATVLDSKARVAWRSKPFKTAGLDHSTLVLGRDLLPEKRYTVRIEEVWQGTARTVGERVIEIVPLWAP